MTEKLVASSDATNITAAITRISGSSGGSSGGGAYRVQGLKWWTSGAMDPRCKVRLPAVFVSDQICSTFCCILVDNSYGVGLQQQGHVVGALMGGVLFPRSCCLPAGSQGGCAHISFALRALQLLAELC